MIQTYPSLNMQTPQVQSGVNLFDTSSFTPPVMPLMPLGTSLRLQQIPSKNGSVSNKVAGSAIDVATNYISGAVSNKIFDDSEAGQIAANVFSTGVSSVGNTLGNNLFAGNALTQGLSLNLGSSMAGAGIGIASNYIGKGITSAMGDSRLGRAIGAGTSTGLALVGGRALQAAKAAKAAQASKAASLTSATNLGGLAMSVVGSALGAALGPSKEYGGKHGNITKTLDTMYDVTAGAVGFIPGAGTLISGAMALNKGLSNLFGSTSGMTTQDAILGSAFAGAPLKWLNMAGATTTDTFKNLSWQNLERTNNFMGDAFGNLGEKFDKAREEAGKTYGTFSRHASNKALDNISFANTAWDKILEMTDQNEIQNIRSLDMATINNQRYAQQILGGWSPTARGKMGMKILNNATNHSVGMRLLSAAALIDNKQMILSKCRDIN